jgi:17beta-estradiol 17-dehydrogenase / very-long-chain 3-oxoacyl-CoA reductase
LNDIIPVVYEKSAYFAAKFDMPLDSSTLTFALSIIGAIVVSYILLSCVIWMLSMLKNRAAGGICSFKETGSWAVITGASRGIGAEFARELASRGFNGVAALSEASHLQRS